MVRAGGLMVSFVFNNGYSMVAGECYLFTKSKSKYIEFDKAQLLQGATIGLYHYQQCYKDVNNGSKMNGYLLRLLNDTY